MHQIKPAVPSDDKHDDGFHKTLYSAHTSDAFGENSTNPQPVNLSSTSLVSSSTSMPPIALAAPLTISSTIKPTKFALRSRMVQDTTPKIPDLNLPEPTTSPPQPTPTQRAQAQAPAASFSGSTQTAPITRSIPLAVAAPSLISPLTFPTQNRRGPTIRVAGLPETAEATDPLDCYLPVRMRKGKAAAAPIPAPPKATRQVPLPKVVSNTPSLDLECRRKELERTASLSNQSPISKESPGPKFPSQAATPIKPKSQSRPALAGQKPLPVISSFTPVIGNPTQPQWPPIQVNESPAPIIPAAVMPVQPQLAPVWVSQSVDPVAPSFNPAATTPAQPQWPSSAQMNLPPATSFTPVTFKAALPAQPLPTSTPIPTDQAYQQGRHQVNLSRRRAILAREQAQRAARRDRLKKREADVKGAKKQN